MNDDHGQDTFVLLLRYAACYLALAVIMVISTWLLLQLRVVIVQIGLALNSTRWAMTAIDQFGFLLLGLLWLIAFFVIEAYLRQGVPTNRLRSRALKVVGWQVIFVIVVFVSLQILT